MFAVTENGTFGRYCNSRTNKRGLGLLLEFVNYNDLMPAYTFDPHKASGRHSPSGEHHNQVDFITTSNSVWTLTRQTLSQELMSEVTMNLWRWLRDPTWRKTRNRHHKDHDFLRLTEGHRSCRSLPWKGRRDVCTPPHYWRKWHRYGHVDQHLQQQLSKQLVGSLENITQSRTHVSLLTY